MLKLRDMLKFRPAEMTKWVSSLQSSEHLWCYITTVPMQSLVAVKNEFRQWFPGRNPPSKNTSIQSTEQAWTVTKIILADQEPRVPNKILQL
jgi:hypothetical protein